MFALRSARAALLICCSAFGLAMLMPVVAQAGPPPPNTFVTAGPDQHELTSDRTPTFRFRSSIVGSTFQCRIDFGAWTACTSPYTTAPLSDGWHDFEVRAISPAAVTDPTPALRHFKVDHQFVPDTEITNGPGNGTTTAGTTPTFTFIATSGFHNLGYPTGRVTTFTCRLDGEAWFSCASPYTTAVLPDGPHTFEVRATRDQRTDLSPATRSFTIDRGVPDTTITGGPTEGSTTSDSTPSFTFTSDRAGATFTCSVDGLAPAACSSPFTLPALADGVHSFAVAASLGGSTDASPAQRTFVIDAPEPPASTIVTTVLLPPIAQPTEAAAPLPASRVSIRSIAARIGATGATKIVLRCSSGSGECEGRLRLVKTIRFRCGERSCFARKTLANQPFSIASGTVKAITLPVTREGIRLVRNTRLDRMFVLAVADSDANDARKAVLLIARRPV